MNKDTIQKMAQASVAGTMAFPEIVGTLIKEGVESYHVDLVLKQNRYYNAEGETSVVAVDLKTFNAASEFSAEGVQAAVRKSQRGEHSYQDFVNAVLKAGCVYYIAYLAGRKVIYFGRKGESHTELFPSAK